MGAILPRVGGDPWTQASCGRYKLRSRDEMARDDARMTRTVVTGRGRWNGRTPIQPRATHVESRNHASHLIDSMNNRNLAKGLFLIAISLIFGLGSFRYPMGGLGRAGPGLFPLMISSLLFLLGVAIVVRAFLAERVRLEFNIKNIGLIMASLVGFAVISEYVNMIAGIVFMVFCASLAATSHSWVRNLMIAGGLVAVALVFQKLLGLQLPLY